MNSYCSVTIKDPKTLPHCTCVTLSASPLPSLTEIKTKPKNYSLQQVGWRGSCFWFVWGPYQRLLLALLVMLGDHIGTVACTMNAHRL